MRVITKLVDADVEAFIASHPHFKSQWDEIVASISKDPATARVEQRNGNTLYRCQQRLQLYSIDYMLVREWYKKVTVSNGETVIVIISVEWQ